MKRLWNLILDEPPVTASIILVVLNIFGIALSEESIVSLEALIESLALFLGGIGARQMVTPTSKIRREAARGIKE